MTLRPATPKERVCAMFPLAYEQYSADDDYYYIYPCPDGGRKLVASIAEGWSSEDAWLDAARRIEKPKEGA